MKTAILTGFQVFGKYAVNPTEILARDLDGTILAGHQIYSLVFPTTVLSPIPSPDYGRMVVEKAFSLHASVIISLGIASEVRGVRVETEGVNWVENDAYCTPFENRQRLFSDRPPHEKKRVPLEAWNFPELSQKLLAAGIPFEVSSDAGSYCCNALMMRVVRAMGDYSQSLPFLFAHVSCTAEAVSEISDFDHVNKVLLHQEEFSTIVEKLLESYHLDR